MHNLWITVHRFCEQTLPYAQEGKRKDDRMPEFDQLSRDENGRICLYEDDRWEEVLSLLKESVNDTQFNAWFLPMKPVLDGDNIIILFENSFSRNVVQRRFLITMESTVASVFNRHYNIKLIIPGEDPQLAPAPDPAKIERQKNLDSMLLPRYTFDTFVVGSSNWWTDATSSASTPRSAFVMENTASPVTLRSAKS